MWNYSKIIFANNRGFFHEVSNVGIWKISLRDDFVNVVWLLLFRLQGNLILSDIGLAEKRIYHAALNGNNSLTSVLHQKEEW